MRANLSPCKTKKNPILIASALLLLAGCKPISHDAVENWLGLWTGPEGTSLVITRRQDIYEVIIKNLNGPRHFSAKQNGKELAFTRDGIAETIHQGDGLATGMKWLAEKQSCLIVKLGEGFCRD